ncbi:MAG TPA: histidine kinase [Hyphomicrobium sp.]|nr:histidine kinase [Hyphomicrobium sp.]
MPLRHRLLALIAILLVASLLGGSILTYWHGLKKIELEMSSAVAVAENAVRDAVLPLLPGPIQDTQIDRIVSSFDGDRHVRARFVTDDGNALYQSHVLMPKDPAPQWLINVLTGAQHNASMELPEGRGHIQLQADSLNEITEVWDDAKLKLAIVGGFCALVAAMISMTLGRALRPLEDLSSALQKVGGGDYEVHVSETGPTELAAIYRGFNTMAGKLAASELLNRQLNEQLNTVQDEERAEIARDLHDEVGPFLFAVDVDAQTIPPLLAQSANDEAIVRVQAIRQSVGHMQTHLRSILERLRPNTLLDLGLAHAAEQLAEFWQARYPSISFDIDCTDESFGPKIDEAAFRILQEGTSNAVRHGKPTKISLATRKAENGTLEITVSDDGSGLRPPARKGLGLAGMRERLALLGGTMSVDTGPDGRGVVLRAALSTTQPALAERSPQREDIEERL